MKHMDYIEYVIKGKFEMLYDDISKSFIGNNPLTKDFVITLDELYKDSEQVLSDKIYNFQILLDKRKRELFEMEFEEQFKNVVQNINTLNKKHVRKFVILEIQHILKRYMDYCIVHKQQIISSNIILKRHWKNQIICKLEYKQTLLSPIYEYDCKVLLLKPNQIRYKILDIIKTTLLTQIYKKR